MSLSSGSGEANADHPGPAPCYMLAFESCQGLFAALLRVYCRSRHFHCTRFLRRGALGVRSVLFELVDGCNFCHSLIRSNSCRIDGIYCLSICGVGWQAMITSIDHYSLFSSTLHVHGVIFFRVGVGNPGPMCRYSAHAHTPALVVLINIYM